LQRPYRILSGGPEGRGPAAVRIGALARTILQRPLIYAHRGGAALRPENTLAAFDNGLALGADGLELDVHLSRDGVVVVHHDPMLERTTNASGAIRLKTAAELAAIDAGYRFVPPVDLPAEAGSHESASVAKADDPGAEAGGHGSASVALADDVEAEAGSHESASVAKADDPGAEAGSYEEGVASAFRRKDRDEFPYRGKGIGVPTLREVLARYQVPLIIELKTPEPALARATVDDLRAANAVDRVALGSFYSQGLHAARAYEPRLATGAAREETRWALYKSWVHWPVRRPAFREFQVPESSGRTRIVTPRFVRHAHRAGLAVKVWTVDTREDVARLLSWGVDGIISDRPDVAVAALRAIDR
jgi:glycerophosphoryl diester phosphodiesterase